MDNNILLLHMDEISGSLSDTSGEESKASVVGAQYGLSGVHNKALEFDGIEDYAKLQDTIIDINNDFTLSLWIKIPSLSQEATIYSQRSSNCSIESLISLIITPDKKLKGTIIDKDESTVQAESTDILEINIWQLVTMVWDASKQKLLLYINEKEVGSSTGTISGTTADHNTATLGAAFGCGASTYFPGEENPGFFFQDDDIPSSQSPGNFGIEFSSDEYNVVQASDNNYAFFSANEGNHHEVSQFLFTISETLDSLQELTFSVKGYSTLNATKTGISLYIRNFKAGAWERVDTTDHITDTTLVFSTNSISTYVNENTKHLWAMVESNGVVCTCSGWNEGNCAAGNCFDDEKEYTRSCTPSNCVSESKCVKVDPPAIRGCHSDNVHYVDECGNVGVLVQDCSKSCTSWAVANECCTYGSGYKTFQICYNTGCANGVCTFQEYTNYQCNPCPGGFCGGNGVCEIITIAPATSSNDFFNNAQSAKKQELTFSSIVNSHIPTSATSSMQELLLLPYFSHSYVNKKKQHNTIYIDSAKLTVHFGEITHPFKGTMDEVAIFNTALILYEIENLYKRGIIHLKTTIKTSDSILLPGDFLGPNTDTHSYYKPEKTHLLNHLNKTKYIQFHTYFKTLDEHFMPKLSSVFINYTRTSLCGNKICEAGESFRNCAIDCCKSDGTGCTDTDHFSSCESDYICHSECNGNNSAFVSSQCDLISIASGDVCVENGEAICSKSCYYTQCEGCFDCVNGTCSENDHSECDGNSNSCFCELGLCSSCIQTQFCSEKSQCLNCSTTCDGLCSSSECFPIDPDCDKQGKATTQCCGNEKCEGILGETCEHCPIDCGVCPLYCGDGVCNKTKGENTCTCPLDCGECEGLSNTTCTEYACKRGNCTLVTKELCCGNDICEYIENTDNCPLDCLQLCGNGKCDEEENIENCAEDCCLSLNEINCNMSTHCTWDTVSQNCKEKNETISSTPFPTTSSAFPTLIATPTRYEITPVVTPVETLTSTANPIDISAIPISGDVSPQISFIDDFQNDDAPKPTIHELTANCICFSDKNPCTNDICENNVCKHIPVVCGTPCEDKKICNKDGQCIVRATEGKSCHCANMCNEGLSCTKNNICQRTVCGDDKCEGSECRTCEKDCNKELCKGNGFCDTSYNENCENIPMDCLCPTGYVCDPENKFSTEYGCYKVKCGDNSCDTPFENQISCCIDCNCPDSYYCDLNSKTCRSYCGNGICDNQECEKCQTDCTCSDCFCDVNIKVVESVSGKTDEKVMLDITVTNAGVLDDIYTVFLVSVSGQTIGEEKIKITGGTSDQISLPIIIPYKETEISLFVKSAQNNITKSSIISVIPEKKQLSDRFRFLFDLKDILEILFLLGSILLALFFSRRGHFKRFNKQKNVQNNQKPQSFTRYTAQQWNQGRYTQQNQWSATQQQNKRY